MCQLKAGWAIAVDAPQSLVSVPEFPPSSQALQSTRQRGLVGAPVVGHRHTDHSTPVARLRTTRGRPHHHRRRRHSFTHPYGYASGVLAPLPPSPAPHTRPASRCEVRHSAAPRRWRGCYSRSHNRQRTSAQPPRLVADTSGEGSSALLAAGAPPAGRPHSHTPFWSLPWRPCCKERRRRLSWLAWAKLGGGGQARRRGPSSPAVVKLASGGQDGTRGQRGRRARPSSWAKLLNSARKCTWRPTQGPPLRPRAHPNSHTVQLRLHTGPTVRQQKVKV